MILILCFEKNSHSIILFQVCGKHKPCLYNSTFESRISNLFQRNWL